MKASLIALACLATMGAAHATYCPPGSAHAGQAEPYYPNRCNESPTSTTKATALGVGVGIAGAQSDAAATAAAIGQGGAGGASSSNATGGQSNSTATGGAAAQRQQQLQDQRMTSQNQNSSGVVIQGAQAGSGDRSTYTATAWAPIIHGPAAPALAAGNLVVVPGVCGPRVRVITTQVVGQHYGAMGGQTDTPNGYTETLGEYLDENGNPAEPFVRRGGYLIGHQVTQYAAILGTSSAASFSVGGFVDSKGLQGGAAGSGARQQLVKGLQVMECVVPVALPLPAATAVPAPAPAAVIKPKRRIVRRAPPCAPALPICVAPAR